MPSGALRAHTSTARMARSRSPMRNASATRPETCSRTTRASRSSSSSRCRRPPGLLPTLEQLVAAADSNLTPRRFSADKPQFFWLETSTLNGRFCTKPRRRARSRDGTQRCFQTCGRAAYRATLDYVHRSTLAVGGAPLTNLVAISRVRRCLDREWTISPICLLGQSGDVKQPTRCFDCRSII
jgi:hypothetical protein